MSDEAPKVASLKTLTLFRCVAVEDGSSIHIEGFPTAINVLKSKVTDGQAAVCTMDSEIRDFALGLFGAFANNQLTDMIESLKDNLTEEALKAHEFTGKPN